MTEITAAALLRLAVRMMKNAYPPVTVETAGSRVTFDSEITQTKYTYRWSGDGWECVVDVDVQYLIDEGRIEVRLSGDKHRATTDLVMLALGLD
jgi:hypothetical protein